MVIHFLLLPRFNDELAKLKFTNNLTYWNQERQGLLFGIFCFLIGLYCVTVFWF